MLIAVLVLTAVGQAACDGLEDARRRGSLLVGVKTDFPPFRSIDTLILRDKVLSPERLNEILDPYQMTRPGIAGGKAPKTDRPHWRGDDEAEKAG